MGKETEDDFPANARESLGDAGREPVSANADDSMIRNCGETRG
jgi:hypothetical protein